MKKDIAIIVLVFALCLFTFVAIYAMPMFIIDEKGKVLMQREMSEIIIIKDSMFIFSLSSAPIPSPISIPRIPRRM